MIKYSHVTFLTGTIIFKKHTKSQEACYVRLKMLSHINDLSKNPNKKDQLVVSLEKGKGNNIFFVSSE